jgi:hypothetical protein
MGAGMPVAQRLAHEDRKFACFVAEAGLVFGASSPVRIRSLKESHIAQPASSPPARKMRRSFGPLGPAAR